MKQSTTDNINRPLHYLTQPVECIEFTEHLPSNAANTIKYLWRFKHKNGAEDLKKARWYLNRELASGRAPSVFGLKKHDVQRLNAELEQCNFEPEQGKAIWAVWRWANGLEPDGLVVALRCVGALLEKLECGDGGN